MAKSRPSKKSTSHQRKKSTVPALQPSAQPMKTSDTRLMSSTPTIEMPPPTPSSQSSTISEAQTLLISSTALLHSSPADALPLATQALDLLSRSTLPPLPSTAPLPALSLLASIQIELGDFPAALTHLHHAVSLDPTGATGGAQPFLWLAQLSESGGQDSMHWLTRATDCLRQALASQRASAEAADDAALDSDTARETRTALATALCSMCEVYMTDLSWEEGAEAWCERLVGEAVLIVPEGKAASEVWQTFASVRISQEDLEGAKQALVRSLASWLPENTTEEEDDDDDDDDGDDGENDGEVREDDNTPDFPTRVALVRLLLEVGMEIDAMRVLDRLVTEDDESVECWYLGGWAMYLLAKKSESKDGTIGSLMEEAETTGEDYLDFLASSRTWLQTSIELFTKLEYEDERLGGHARELLQEVDGVLGVEDDEEVGGSVESDEEHDDDDDHGDGDGEEDVTMA